MNEEYAKMQKYIGVKTILGREGSDYNV